MDILKFKPSGAINIIPFTSKSFVNLFRIFLNLNKFFIFIKL